MPRTSDFNRAENVVETWSKKFPLNTHFSFRDLKNKIAEAIYAAVQADRRNRCTGGQR